MVVHPEAEADDPRLQREGFFPVSKTKRSLGPHRRYCILNDSTRQMMQSKPAYITLVHGDDLANIFTCSGDPSPILHVPDTAPSFSNWKEYRRLRLVKGPKHVPMYLPKKVKTKPSGPWHGQLNKVNHCFLWPFSCKHASIEGGLTGCVRELEHLLVSGQKWIFHSRYLLLTLLYYIAPLPSPEQRLADTDIDPQ